MYFLKNQGHLEDTEQTNFEYVKENIRVNQKRHNLEFEGRSLIFLKEISFNIFNKV